MAAAPISHLAMFLRQTTKLERWAKELAADSTVWGGRCKGFMRGGVLQKICCPIFAGIMPSLEEKEQNMQQYSSLALYWQIMGCFLYAGTDGAIAGKVQIWHKI